jgi:two-component system sensor histidine kinase ResE
VLSNLISNALRHTPNGGRIVIETGASQDEARRVRIQVRDSGAGIRPEDLPFIFDRFWRGDRARTRGANATSGLGLAIAKQLIDAHGGTITVQSVVGLGSNFIIDLLDRLDYPA